MPSSAFFTSEFVTIKDTLKEDKPPSKGQAKSTHVYTLYRKSPLKEDNLSTKDKTAGPEGVLIKVPLYILNRYQVLPFYFFLFYSSIIVWEAKGKQ